MKLKADRLILLCVLSLSAFPFLLWAQAPNRTTDNDDLSLKDRSLSLGFHVHAYGLGFDAQYSRLHKRLPQVEHLFTLQLSSFKDKRELRVPSIYQAQGGKNFIFDKKNYCYVLATTYGRQWNIVPRTVYTRLSFSVGASAGPAFALLKPYNVDIAVPVPGSNPPKVVAQTFQYDHNRFNFNDIIGEADFFSGIDQLKIIPGLRLRVHTSLNLSGTNLLVRAIHTGFGLDIFPKNVEIMSNLENRPIFFGGFLGFMIGNAWKVTK